MNRLLLKIVLPLLILAAGWRVQGRFRAAQIARLEATPESLERAMQLDPQEPDYPFRLGVAHRDLPELQNPRLAKAYLEKAAALNPHNWRFQRELAQLYELSGQTRDAEQAFLRAVDLSPRNGAYRWRLANFYLRSRSFDQAVSQLELALAADRTLMGPAFGLLLSAGGNYRQIDRIWPADAVAGRYLLKLAGQQQSTPQGEDFQRELWHRLLAGAEPLPLADAQVYLGRLIEEQRFEEARARWIELAGSHGMPDAGFELGNNLIWNGDFERYLTQAAFGWSARDGGGYTVTLAAGEGMDDSAALRITFDGSQNLSFSGVQQRVIVDPGRAYRLSFRARGQDLSTDQGVFFEVQDGPSRRRLLATERLLGSMPWAEYSTALVPPSPWIHVLLRRDPSLRFDNRLSGVLWIDSVKLEAAGS